MNQKNEKGITLIALVITIIVLLILAGVTINMVLGDEGIIQNAQQAKEQHTEKTYEETIELAYLTHRTRVLAKEPGYEKTLEVAINDELNNIDDKEESIDYLEPYGENLIATINEESFLVDENGKVEKVIKFTIENRFGIVETYYAREGYTWLDWVNDEKFSLDKFKLEEADDPWVVTNDGYAVCTEGDGYWGSDGVHGTEGILENGGYFAYDRFGELPDQEL